jgi:hypothetical protein
MVEFAVIVVMDVSSDIHGAIEAFNEKMSDRCPYYPRASSSNVPEMAGNDGTADGRLALDPSTLQ